MKLFLISISALLIALVLSLSVFAVDLKVRETTDHIFTPRYHELTAAVKKDIDCLADNIYFEAAHEPSDGKIGVIFVTMNRVEHKLWPSNVCDVVKEKYSGYCQFSWFCMEKYRTMSADKVLTKTNDMLYRGKIVPQIMLTHQM